jgi:hypothetical protein
VSKIWYCRNCGYEVTSRGRCHLCRDRLVASALPELPAGEDDDEVGYRLEGWSDRDRGRLIERLNVDEVLHRFEDDELVVAAEDEARVDDLVEELAANPDDQELAERGPAGVAEDGPPGEGWDDAHDEPTTAALRLLADAAGRLRRDPTDMNADADVAEASAAVFMAEDYSGADADTWAAVGRVTRRLLSALGADEALEDEIQTQAAVLEKLLNPLLGGPADAAADAVADQPDDETVYELPDWLPEQRAQLGIFLDEASIHYEWEGDDLVVPASREDEVEALFGRVGRPLGDDDDEDDDGEARYRALEELFAAADRLAADPADEQLAADTAGWIEEAAGPPPIGLDEVQWFRIMTQARTLSESIRADREQAISEDAAALRDLLRAVV